MPTKTPRLTKQRRDPADVGVQVTLRMPFWYREQLIDEAADLNTTPSMLILDAVQRLYPPKRPTE